MIDEIKNFENEEINNNNNIGGDILQQKKLIENEFEEQVEQMRKVKQNIGIIQQNLMGKKFDGFNNINNNNNNLY
jgi:hypothetical protein